jgi:hypothetical protein
MDFAWLLPLLALGTLLIVLVMALRSKNSTERRKHDPDAKKSSLAADGDTHDPAP